MRRAFLVLVCTAALTLTGLVLAPTLRATALGETSVTLSCNDGTGLTLLVDAAELAELTAAVQGMIDYPAGLSCTLTQNPLPLTTLFGHVALAATANEFIVDGGRWAVDCSVILGGGNPTYMPDQVVARSGTRPALASRITTAPLMSPDCPTAIPACVWVNIGVNVHFTGNGEVKGTLNETIPENQTCTAADGTTIDVGPSHFTSKPTCLYVNAETHQAAVISTVTQISGLEAFPGTAQGFFVEVGDEIRASFFDSQNNPGQQTPPEDRDHLNAPPSADDSDCGAQFAGTQFNVQQRGNINVHP